MTKYKLLLFCAVLTTVSNFTQVLAAACVGPGAYAQCLATRERLQAQLASARALEEEDRRRLQRALARQQGEIRAQDAEQASVNADEKKVTDLEAALATCLAAALKNPIGGGALCVGIAGNIAVAKYALSVDREALNQATADVARLQTDVANDRLKLNNDANTIAALEAQLNALVCVPPPPCVSPN